MLTKIKNNWQLLTVTLLLWSFFDLYYFYSRFGIDIQNFVSVTELPLLVLPTILRGLAALMVVTGLIVFQHAGKKRHADQPTIERKMFEPRKYWRDLMDSWKKKRWVWVIIDFLSMIMHIGSILFCFSILALFIAAYFINEGTDLFTPTTKTKYHVLFLVLVLGWFPLLMVISEWFESRAHPFYQGFSFGNTPLAYIAVSFVILSICSSQVDYSNITRGHGLKTVSFTDHERKIQTDSCVVYVGATQTYLFLRNNLDNTNLVFKTQDVSNLTIK